MKLPALKFADKFAQAPQLGRGSSSSSGGGGGGGSSPDTWPTFTAASHVTVLLREKAPFVSQPEEGGRSLG